MSKLINCCLLLSTPSVFSQYNFHFVKLKSKFEGENPAKHWFSHIKSHLFQSLVVYKDKSPKWDDGGVLIQSLSFVCINTAILMKISALPHSHMTPPYSKYFGHIVVGDPESAEPW